MSEITTSIDEQINALEVQIDGHLIVLKANTASIGLLQKRVNELLDTMSALTNVIEEKLKIQEDRLTRLERGSDVS